MITLLKNANVINVFTDSIEKKDVIIENDTILGYLSSSYKIDKIIDCENKYICPSFIDSHIHIESTMLLPNNLAKALIPHGTGAIICDPHEIANVVGRDGIKFMLDTSKNLPLDFYFMLPSCVPATHFDESKEIIRAKELKEFYKYKRVLGLAEVMNYVGVINNDENIIEKINDALKRNKIVDGHAPFLTGNDLDKYIRSGIMSDHECSNIEEANEKLSKGQWIMIREGTAAKNLEALIDLFDDIRSTRCLLVSDDRNPSTLINEGHIDSIIKKAVRLGKSPITGIRMATIQPANYFHLKNVGAIAPGFKANLLILDDLNEIKINSVFKDGKIIYSNNKLLANIEPITNISNEITNTINIAPLKKDSFYIKPQDKRCHIISVQPKELITDDLLMKLDFTKNNGIDIDKDILKIAVIERHHKTNHIGLGYIKGIGLKAGAIASTVSHDSHNIIAIGTNDNDMLKAIEEIKRIGGGNVYVKDNTLIASLELKIAGLMSENDVYKTKDECDEIIRVVHENGVPSDIAPFMNMAFISLPVIPSLKITTKGLVDVNNFKLISLFED